MLAQDGTLLSNQAVPLGVSTTVVPTLYETFWTAPFAGNFYLQVTTAQSLSSVQFYYLTVYRKNNGAILAGDVDVLRN